MISKIVIRHLNIRYPLSMISKPKYVLYTYSGYSFEKKKEKEKKREILTVNDIIANH